ncbi:MAG: gliding motility-associated C-terminal domain-containing protein, partial [Bacteroidetes bacterium]
DLYILGQYRDEPIPGVSGAALLLNLDTNLSPKWSKIYYAEHFNYYKASLNIKSDGELVLAYSTKGFFPTILASIDSNGEISEQLGYPFHTPSISPMEDGSLVIGSNFSYNDTIGIFTNLSLSKTDKQGYIDNCDVFSTCLLSRDVPLSYGAIEVDTFTITEPDSIPMNVEPWNFSFKDECSVPPAPSPYFSFPDTICAGECTLTGDTKNRLAHARQWHLRGPGAIDTIINDSLNFNYCFEVSGEYELTQSIWFLGCESTFSHTFRVLDELQSTLPSEKTVCTQPPFQLTGSASRPLTTFLWGNGNTNPILEIDTSGTYTLIASDGYCTIKDTIFISFIEDLLTSGEAIILPPDTSVCEQHLPYLLTPQSPYTQIFYAPELMNEPGSVIPVNRPGTFTVQTNLFGCDLTNRFTLTLKDCQARIYFPTAFSPNDDGINDQFSPQGLYFEEIEFQIYDRWGGLIFTTKKPPFVWDGAGFPTGIYVFRFRYFNTLSMIEEEIRGSVLLIK